MVASPRQRGAVPCQGARSRLLAAPQLLQLAVRKRSLCCPCRGGNTLTQSTNGTLNNHSSVTGDGPADLVCSCTNTIGKSSAVGNVYIAYASPGRRRGFVGTPDADERPRLAGKPQEDVGAIVLKLHSYRARNGTSHVHGRGVAGRLIHRNCGRGAGRIVSRTVRAGGVASVDEGLCLCAGCQTTRTLRNLQ